MIYPGEFSIYTIGETLVVFIYGKLLVGLLVRGLKSVATYVIILMTKSIENISAGLCVFKPGW